MAANDKLLSYFRDIADAARAAARGEGSLPYRHGSFMVTALAGDIELTISDITEEDAILIAAELTDMGARALLRGSVICDSCGLRVPAQDYCTNCRAKLA
ncbi:MAG TPA: hypothetical protein VF171_07440 [Trueperaceae bacterium]